MEMNNLSGKTVIVNGAGSGSNRDIALQLGMKGAQVVCVDGDAGANQETVDMIIRRGGEAFAVNADIAEAATARALLQRIADRVGSEPIFINQDQVVSSEELARQELSLNTGDEGQRAIYVRGTKLTRESLAKMIDYSILHPFAQDKDIKEGLEYCRQYKFNSFCVNPHHLDQVVKGLKGTGVEPSVVIDFPFGSGTGPTKLAASQDAIERGAEALDVVIDIAALKDKDYQKVTGQIREVVEATGVTTKIIIEVAYLTKDEIAAASKCVEEGGGTYVKSSTGRADRGPTMEEVKIMRDSVSSRVGVKVAGTGKFWTSTIALGCLLAGADLVGTRAGPEIVEDLPLMEWLFGGIRG